MDTGKSLKVVHLTSAHTRDDTRIFVKECVSLASFGFSVSLIVGDGKGSGAENGIEIYDVGVSSGRLDRILRAPNRVLEKAVELDAAIYHLHDPELIPIGLKLKKMGKIVVFDAHEDLPKQLLGKPYLNKPLRWGLSKAFSIFEEWACPKFDAIVAATPYIRDKFLELDCRAIDVNNYPLIRELATEDIVWPKKMDQVVYVGGLEKARGILEIVRAIGLSQSSCRLKIGGVFADDEFENDLKSLVGWEKTDYLGWLDRLGVSSVLQSSLAGLVTLHPLPNYLDALPVKMFEYMAAGLPVIASDFPLWKEILEGNDCGLCVNPLNPNEIAEAIGYLINNPKVAEHMGYNGRRAVLEKYNWDLEESKLLDLYQSLYTLQG